MLFHEMVCEKLRNSDLAEALRDVNENRLSKFEVPDRSSASQILKTLNP